MYGKCQRVADAEHCSESIGAGTQVCYLAQELQCVTLLLKGIVGDACGAIELNLVGLNLDSLAFALRSHSHTLHMQ